MTPLWLPLLLAPALVQEPAPSDPHPGEAYEIELITMGPGDAIWERFGHNAILVRDLRTGSEVAYNWGMFDFGSEDFLARLVQGEMRYWMTSLDHRAALRYYEENGRDVWAQRLRLTPDQRLEMVRVLRATDTDANRFYAYDYYLDNCSTRVRDVIDLVVGGRLRAAVDTIPADVTWRWHARRILQEVPWAYAGMEFALGTPADRPISAWEEMFLPLILRDYLGRVTVPGPDGTEVPLVVRETQVVEGTRPPRAPEPNDWTLRFLLAGALVAAAFVLLARSDPERGVVRVILVAALASWAAASGLAGALLAGAWMFTDHTFWYWNENLFLANPLWLLVALALLPAFRGGPHRWLRPLAAVVMGVAALGVAVQVLPPFDQFNREILAFALPIHVAFAWSVIRLERA